MEQERENPLRTGETLCERCQPLNAGIRLRWPSDVRHTLAILAERLTEGELLRLHGPEPGAILSAGECRAFTALFQCTHCGTRFLLLVDTPDCSSEWRPLAPGAFHGDAAPAQVGPSPLTRPRTVPDLYH